MQHPEVCSLFVVMLKHAGEACRLLLFLGGVDSSVRVHLKPPEGAFSQQCVLKGHSNWIRGLSAAHIVNSSGKPAVYIASASQDRTARLWKVAEAPIDPGVHDSADVVRPQSTHSAVQLGTLRYTYSRFVKTAFWMPDGTIPLVL